MVPGVTSPRLEAWSPARLDILGRRRFGPPFLAHEHSAFQCTSYATHRGERPRPVGLEVPLTVSTPTTHSIAPTPRASPSLTHHSPTRASDRSLLSPVHYGRLKACSVLLCVSTYVHPYIPVLTPSYLSALSQDRFDSTRQPHHGDSSDSSPTFRDSPSRV